MVVIYTKFKPLKNAIDSFKTMQGKGFEPLNSQREQIAQTRTVLESAAFGQASLPLHGYIL